ncbi:MAG TPA: RidA family protein [Luteibacter sp.]|jgi:enamine deaminase RidA (YjgF/YER057c/UK114 family)|nr:RidA family protein [Luteibacter sp.]
MRTSFRFATLALLLTSFPLLAQDVVRYKIPGSDFPISAAVEVPAGKSIVFLSGVVPPVANASAAKGSLEAYGDTKTQTVGALGAIEKQLKTMNLSMGDVVKMQVFLVGDPAKGGKMDFAGFMEGYRQYFGTAQQPKLPSRSAVQVAALASPGFLIEIEVTAVRP